MFLMSVELDEGQVLFQYNLGSGVAQVESSEKYNDGQWHKLSANRLAQSGLLQIDGATGSFQHYTLCVILLSLSAPL